MDTVSSLSRLTPLGGAAAGTGRSRPRAGSKFAREPNALTAVQAACASSYETVAVSSDRTDGGEQLRIAEELRRGNPDFIVMWGIFSRKYWARYTLTDAATSPARTARPTWSATPGPGRSRTSTGWPWTRHRPAVHPACTDCSPRARRRRSRPARRRALPRRDSPVSEPPLSIVEHPVAADALDADAVPLQIPGEVALTDGPGAEGGLPRDQDVPVWGVRPGGAAVAQPGPQCPVGELAESLGIPAMVIRRLGRSRSSRVRS
jgi:hypothetical protein